MDGPQLTYKYICQQTPDFYVNNLTMQYVICMCIYFKNSKPSKFFFSKVCMQIWMTEFAEKAQSNLLISYKHQTALLERYKYNSFDFDFDSR